MRTKAKLYKGHGYWWIYPIPYEWNPKANFMRFDKFSDALDYIRTMNNYGYGFGI
jgi:hypothetical protein